MNKKKINIPFFGVQNGLEIASLSAYGDKTFITGNIPVPGNLIQTIVQDNTIVGLFEMEKEMVCFMVITCEDGLYLESYYLCDKESILEKV